jgi:hypothetical protein
LWHARRTGLHERWTETGDPGNTTMPFSKYQVSPEHIEAMRSAFHKVCAVLQLDCKPGEPLTDVIVAKIIEHARAGETDPERLCSQVLIELAAGPDDGAE